MENQSSSHLPIRKGEISDVAVNGGLILCVCAEKHLFMFDSIFFLAADFWIPKVVIGSLNFHE